MSASSAPKTVLIGPAGYASYCSEGRQLLIDAGYRLIENPHDRPYTRPELEALAPEIDAAVVGIEAWPAELLARAPRLKALTKLGVGVDNIALEAARSQGIDVCNAPGGNANAVAEFAVGLILATLREIPKQDALVRSGGWERIVGPELRGRRVGLLGFGTIGALVAKKLLGFECEVVFYDPYPNQERARELGVESLSLDEVLASADILSLHLPSVPETYHLADDAFFRKLRPGAYFINTARGALVDEAALIRALTSGHLRGAGLDVFENEPVAADSELLGQPNVVVTSHGAADSFESYQRISVINAEAIIAALEGGLVKNVVN